MSATAAVDQPDAVRDPSAARQSGRLVAVLAAIAVIAVVGTCFFVIQFATDALIGTDGYFHVKYSYLMSHGYGFIRSLPWLHFTIHRDSYRDHHLLFHVLYIPFTFGDLRLGGKVAAWLFATLGVGCFYLVASRRGKACAAICTFMLMGAAKIFLTRMCMPRVPSLSMLFMVLGIHAIITRRYRWLAAVLFLFVWLYDGFALMLPVMAAFLIAGRLTEGRWEWRMVAWGVGGVLAGMVVNPYFPGNIQSYWFNLWRVSSGAQIIARTGREWLPLDSWVLLTSATVIWIGLAIALLLAVLRGRPTRESLALFLTVIFATVLVMKGRRYLDTWPPLVMLFLVYAWADFWESCRERLGQRGQTWRRIATAALALLILFTPFKLHAQWEKTRKEKPFAYYKGAADHIRQATHGRPGTIVFNADWDDFPYLFFFNSDSYYILGLDQLYMMHYDKRLFDLWNRIRSGKVKNPAGPIYENFGAAYAVADRKQQLAFILQAAGDRNMKQVYDDPYCVVYRVVPP